MLATVILETNLPKDVARKAIARGRKAIGRRAFDSLHVFHKKDALRFTFADTPEGSAYWEKYKSILSNL